MASARRAILISVLAVVVVAVLVVMDDWRLWQRYLTQPDDIANPANALWFSPRATVAEGAGAELAVAAENARTLPAQVLEDSWAYAESMGTGALIIAHDGMIQFERYGTGMDQRTLFQSQSLHKGLTAMAFGAAIQSGAIPSAETVASSYLSEWSDSTPHNRVTLADLAYMQAGLERSRFANHPFSPGLQLFMSGRLVERTLATPFVANPREVFIWSNASTQALAIAIERAVGKPWSAFIAESIWDTIGGGEAYVQLDHEGGTAQSFCCLITNARNWLRVGEVLLNDGRVAGRRVLPRGWVGAMTTGGVTNPNYGMQLWLNEPYDPEILRNGLPRFVVPRGERLAATDAFYIEGHFAQRLHVVPSAGLVVVRLGDDRRDWDDAKLMNGLIRAAQTRRAGTPLPQINPPRTPYSEEAEPAPPDYSGLVAWAAHPAKRDAADFVAGGESADKPVTTAHAFYVHPTTYRGSTWNAALDDPDAIRSVDAVVMGQASVLNDCCAVHAPRYRQAGSAAVFDQSGSGPQAYQLAFGDVRSAFEQFILDSDGAPFILMGHSQGAFHLQRLISEVVVPRRFADRLIVAYIIGVAVPQAVFAGDWQSLQPCSRAEQTGCVMSWATFGPAANAPLYQRLVARRFPELARPDGGIDILCTNPLTGSTASADASTNRGAVPVPVPGAYLAESIAGVTGAGCDGGLLRLDVQPGAPFVTLVMPVDNYHFYDVALFYENLRADASTRAEAFLRSGN